MDIIKLKDRPEHANDFNLIGMYAQFNTLLTELNARNLPEHTVKLINDKVEALNNLSLPVIELKKLLKQEQTAIIKLLEKEHKIVPKGYHSNLWMLFGFTAIGLPIGTTFGLLMGNIGLMAIGLPIGMGIGALIGASMDKKAFAEGRQLTTETKLQG